MWCRTNQSRPLARVDENAELPKDNAGKPAGLCLGKLTRRNIEEPGLTSGCYTARGELDELKTYCPPERKSKNVLFTPR